MPSPLRLLVFAASALASFTLFAADITVEKSFASAADFDPFFRDASIDLQSSPGAITLRREFVIPPPVGNKLEGGVNGRTPISPDRLARKTFTLPDARNGDAEIFAFSGSTGTTALVNGSAVDFVPFPPRSGWTRAEVPATLLRAGANELVFSNAFVLSQDRESKPETSFFSTNGGRSWKPADGGEFLISLRIRRYAPKGVITSTVIDTATTGTVDSIAPLIKIRSLSVQWRAIVPGPGSVTLEARSGPTPWPDGAWSGWSPADRVLPARYVQVRATLQAGAGDVAPSLARLTVTARGEAVADAESQGCVLHDLRNPPLVRSSAPYAFQRPSDKLARLREQFKLDDVVAAGATDLDKALLLRNWVRTRWTCNDAGSGERTWDALEILNAPEGQHGMCVHFATVFYQCALALGFNARPVILSGHFVADLWCKELGKWVLMDVESVQREGFRLHGTAYYRDAKTREPLGVLELHQAVARALEAGESNVTGVVQLYAMDTEAGPFTLTEAVRGPDSGLGIFRSFCLTPRNNYLDQLEPWEEMHGQNHYHSDAYLWWRTNPPFERNAQYSRRTDRAGDINWTVHTPHLALTATETPGVLAVTADTVTPNLKAFRFAASGQEPLLAPGDGTDPDSRRASFTWRLAPGLNTLSVTTLNRFDREGRAATASVEWKQP